MYLCVCVESKEREGERERGKREGEKGRLNKGQWVQVATTVLFLIEYGYNFGYHIKTGFVSHTVQSFNLYN